MSELCGDVEGRTEKGEVMYGPTDSILDVVEAYFRGEFEYTEAKLRLEEVGATSQIIDDLPEIMRAD